MTQQKILSATLMLFSKKGYFNTSVRDIAHESGVSIGSIYHHFKDKEAIASAVYSNLVERMLAEITQIQSKHIRTSSRCRAIIAFLFDITEQEPEVMEFMLYSKHREFLPEEPPVCSSKPFELMREIVKDGMLANEIQSMDLMVASSCLFGAALRMITSRLDGVIEKPLPTYLEAIWTPSWRAVSTQTL